MKAAVALAMVLAVAAMSVAISGSRGGCAQGQPRMTTRRYEVQKTDAEWRRELTPEQFHVLREAGTERAFSGAHWNAHHHATYVCAGCGNELFASDAKFDSGTGWPSFTAPIAPERVESEEDESYGMSRTEVRCARCGGHLGHVFPDGPAPAGLRYCINSAALRQVRDTSRGP